MTVGKSAANAMRGLGGIHVTLKTEPGGLEGWRDGAPLKKDPNPP